MKKYHNVKNIRFEKQFLLITVDGKDYKIDLRRYSGKLATADDASRMKFEVTPSGYGIHWPILDEDLSIDGLISPAVRKAG